MTETFKETSDDKVRYKNKKKRDGNSTDDVLLSRKYTVPLQKPTRKEQSDCDECAQQVLESDAVKTTLNKLSGIITSDVENAEFGVRDKLAKLQGIMLR